MDDDALLGSLRDAVARYDDVPAAAVTAARASLTWRTIDAELAELAFDSLADTGTLVRGTGDYRLLTFETGEVSVEVEIAVAGAGRRLSAQVVPPGVAEVEVRTPAATTAARTDAHGRLAPVDIARGLVSLRVVTAGTTVVTAWVTA